MIYSIINQKGGVGKTTTAHAIGSGLLNKGNKVLFIDLDSQCNLTDTLLSEDQDTTIYEVITGNIDIKEAITHTGHGDIIPGSPGLAVLDITSPYTLKEHIEPIKRDYDYIVIDTPPALSMITINALTVTDKAIIPTQADRYSLKGIGALYDTIRTVKENTNNKLSIAGIVITRCNERTTLTKDMIENIQDIAKTLKTKVYNTHIRENIAIKEAQAVRTDIFNYSRKSNGAIDYEALINEL